MHTSWECASRVRKSVQRVLRRVAVRFVLPGSGMVARSRGQGPPSQPAESRLKERWVQMEGLNSLLLMHEEYGKQRDVYFKAFQPQWQFIQAYQIDSDFHGVYEMVGPDGKPVNPDKGQIWKAAYHEGRELLNVSERLRRLAGVEGR